MRMQTQARMPAKAWTTMGLFSNCVRKRAMMEMMTMDGKMVPSVAKTPPQKPLSLRPMNVATLTAIMPGVTWLMA